MEARDAARVMGCGRPGRQRYGGGQFYWRARISLPRRGHFDGLNHAGLRSYVDDGDATIAFPCGDVRARRFADLPEAAVCENSNERQNSHLRHT